VLGHYRSQHVPVHDLDGTGTPDDVFNRIRTALSGISSRQ